MKTLLQLVLSIVAVEEATAQVVECVRERAAFRSGRDFSAWVRLVPKQNSSGGKDKLGSISKQGDRYLRSLFTAGALAVIHYAKIHGWASALAYGDSPT
jgi:transposase